MGSIPVSFSNTRRSLEDAEQSRHTIPYGTGQIRSTARLGMAVLLFGVVSPRLSHYSTYRHLPRLSLYSGLQLWLQ